MSIKKNSFFFESYESYKFWPVFFFPRYIFLWAWHSIFEICHRYFFDVTGIFLKIVTGVLEFGNVTGKNVTTRQFSTFWDLSRAFSKCHGHFFCLLFFYHKVKFHKIIWLKEYRLYRISSPRGSSFTAKKTLKMFL